MKKTILAAALCATMVYAATDDNQTNEAIAIEKVRPGASADFIGARVLNSDKRSFEQSKYMPDISLILDASYVHRDADQDEIAHFEVPGIAHGLLGSHNHDGATHATYNANEGFNLNYAELVMSSSVDPFFSMEAVFHLSEHGLEIEEAFFTSTALENGLRFKGGKFNSNFGYLNQQHHHVWDFADMPLVYESFLGMHGINEKGVQLQWTAPTPFYLMLGAEVLQGENEQMFGNATIGDPEAPIAKYADAPSLYVAYAKASFDIGNATVLGGISYARGASRIDHSEDAFEEESKPHAFSGVSSLYGADLLLKYYFDSYSFLKFQNEYLYREMDGTQYTMQVEDGPFLPANITKKQGGFYSQLIYAHNKNWQTGVRYDAITQNDVSTNPNIATGMDKYTAMVEYHTSEFARFRLQYDRSNAMYNEADEQQHIDTIILQANISIGAHAAHSF